MVFDPLLIPFSDDCFPSLDTYSFASLKERVQQIQDKTISRYYLSYIMNYFKSTDNKIQVLAPRDLRYPTFPVQVYLSAEGIMWHNESYWHEFTERPYTSTSIFGNFHYYGHSLNAQNEFLTDSLSFSETGRINSIETTEDGTEIYQITQVSNDKTINYKLIRYSLQSNDTIYYVYERYNADNTTDIPNIVNLYGMQGDHCFRFHLSHPSAPITEEFIFSFGITDEYYEELDADPPIQTPA
ncbi:MAG: hypothetical protein IJX80_06950 [Clostridia bacterium]|nr:hypothetical protein [Clostridia bacterium]